MTCLKQLALAILSQHAGRCFTSGATAQTASLDSALAAAPMLLRWAKEQAT
jgi:hypothetical protein